MPQTHALRRYNYNLFLISRIFQYIHFFSRLSFISLNHSLFFFLFNIFKFPRALASPPQLSVGGRVLRWMFYSLSLLSTMKHRKNIKSKIRHCLQAIGGEKVARARLCSRASIKGHLHLVPSFPAYFSFPCSGLCPRPNSVICTNLSTLEFAVRSSLASTIQNDFPHAFLINSGPANCLFQNLFQTLKLDALLPALHFSACIFSTTLNLQTNSRRFRLRISRPTGGSSKSVSATLVFLFLNYYNALLVQLIFIVTIYPSNCGNFLGSLFHRHNVLGCWARMILKISWFPTVTAKLPWTSIRIWFHPFLS